MIQSIRVDLPLELTAKLIPDEEYWQRASLAQWNICNVSKHGGSWKQLYFENEVKRLIENFVPGKSSESELTRTLAIAKDFVRILNLEQLFPAYHETYLATDPKPDHMDTQLIAKSLTRLEELSLYYGVKNCGMDFSWNYYGLTLTDCQYLHNILKNSSNNKTLRKLTVRQSDMDDLKAKMIAAGLVDNTVLVHLDLSHNKIGDAGCKALARVLAKNTPLATLLLSNNRIEQSGARAISDALATNRKITHLDLSLNPLCDDGVAALLTTLATANPTLQHLNLSSTWITQAIVPGLCDTVRKSTGLRALDLSSNKFAENDGKVLIEALRENAALERIDLRFNGLDTTQLNAIQYIYESRKSAALIDQQQRQLVVVGGGGGAGGGVNDDDKGGLLNKDEKKVAAADQEVAEDGNDGNDGDGAESSTLRLHQDSSFSRSGQFITKDILAN